MDASITAYKFNDVNKNDLSYWPPDVYLGSKITKYHDPSTIKEGHNFWDTNGNHYIKNIIISIQ